MGHLLSRMLKIILILLKRLHRYFFINIYNKIITRILHPRLIIKRGVTFDFNKNSVFKSDSNSILHDTVITIRDNSFLNLRKHAWLGNNVTVVASGISIGRYTAIHAFGSIIGHVSIGDYVMIAKNVFISSGKHHYDFVPELPIKMQDQLYVKTFGEYHDEVVIENDVWIGVNCVIKSGVKIGKGAIVGANSVVACNIEPYAVYAGAPAKKIKTRYAFNPPTNIDSSKQGDLPYFYAGFNVENTPLLFKENAEFYSASSQFSLALNTDFAEYVSLRIRTKHRVKENLSFNNQSKPVSQFFEDITFNLEFYNEEILIFKTEHFKYFLDDNDVFEVKTAWVH